jgi:hypothetical protein
MHSLTVEFALLSEAVNEAFEVTEEGQNDTDLFWDRFSDSCPISYGDASYTLVKSSVVLDIIAEVVDRVSEADFFDEFEEEPGDTESAQERVELFSGRCAKVQTLIFDGPEYVDLEN